MCNNIIDTIVFVLSTRIELYTVTSKVQLYFLTSGQGQKVTYLGHTAYDLMRLDKRNIVKPASGLYLNPINSYKQKHILTS